MAAICEVTPEMEQDYQDWLAELEPHVRAVAARFRPWLLYRMKTNHRATIRSFEEQRDGSVTLLVRVTGEFNAVMFDRDVFGVAPEALTECDLPEPGEPLGALLKDKAEIHAYLDKLRADYEAQNN